MNTVKCTAERFRKIRNPYTGEPVETMMLVPSGGAPMFFARDTYSTYDFFPTAEEAFDMWNRVDGVKGLRDASNPVCAYLGEPLRIEQVPGFGFHFTGGFNPKTFMSDGEYLRKMLSRNGVPPEGMEGIGKVSYGDEPDERTPMEDDSVQPSDEALHIAEKVVNQFKDQVGMKHERTVVSMSRRGKRK